MILFAMWLAKLHIRIPQEICSLSSLEQILYFNFPDINILLLIFLNLFMLIRG